MHVNAVVPFFASLFVGAIPAGFAIQYPKEWTRLVSCIGPKIIFAESEVTTTVKQLVKDSGLDIEVITFGTEFEEFMNIAMPNTEFAPDNVSDMYSTAIIFLSSGTTGASKAICSNHVGFLTGCYQFIDNGCSAKMILCSAPIVCATIVRRVALAVLTGGAWVLLKEFNPSNIWKSIEQYQVTTCIFVPREVRALLDVPDLVSTETTQLESFILVGGSISIDEVNAIRKIHKGANVLPTYGMAELNGVVLLFNANKESDLVLLEQKPESSGKPVAGFQYKVLHTDTLETLGPNQLGELRVKSDYCMNGYIDSKVDFWDSQGFCKTGDLVYYDEDSCFYIVDRISEMFTSRSKLISPLYLEKIIVAHPKIKAAAVVGIPHPEDGNHPTAVVVVKSNIALGKILAFEIQAFVDSQVDDHYKLRGGVKFIGEIPLTASGKIKRGFIRDLVLSGQI